VYARDGSEPEKQPVAMRWVEFLWRSRRGRISVQVLNEYYTTVTNKLKPGRSLSLARQDVSALFTWAPLVTTSSSLERAWKLQDSYALSWWDSLVVTAALEAGCTYLVSEDMQENLQIEQLRIINPFKLSPEAL
jgi:predicted nucleic acid-binding protein